MTPERRYRESINKLLPPTVYTQTMGGTQTNGTPDSYYEGRSILWVEWKYTRTLSPRVFPDSKNWVLQRFWLDRCHKNGHQCAVICGTPVGAYVFVAGGWRDRKITDCLQTMNNKQAVADWIAITVGRTQGLSHKLF